MHLLFLPRGKPASFSGSIVQSHFSNMLPFNNRPRPRAFTLIEVIVAVSILAIGITVILRYFLYVNSSVDVLETDMVAGQFLKSTLDKIIIGLQANKTVSSEASSGSTTINGHLARWNWSFTPVKMGESPPAPGQDLQDLAVEIAWKQEGRDRSLQIDRYASFIKERE